MICRLFVFRHAETYDNCRKIFSGWRDSLLTPRGLLQARQIAGQIADGKIDYAFTSHLKRARRTLEIVLENHPKVPLFIDDRIMERCYGLLQGKSKEKLSKERPQWYAQVHRGYDFPPPEGESLKMVEKRVLSFLLQLKDWLQLHPGNVAISCHGNSLRPIRKTFEHLSLKQMLQLENPQDRVITYSLTICSSKIESTELGWQSILVPKSVRLSTDPRNPLKEYYA
jgi:2,3-bisphosphoglycerate-dependent phosphoglycerate mutase